MGAAAERQQNGSRTAAERQQNGSRTAAGADAFAPMLVTCFACDNHCVSCVAISFCVFKSFIMSTTKQAAFYLPTDKFTSVVATIVATKNAAEASVDYEHCIRPDL